MKYMRKTLSSATHTDSTSREAKYRGFLAWATCNTPYCEASADTDLSTSFCKTPPRFLMTPEYDMAGIGGGKLLFFPASGGGVLPSPLFLDALEGNGGGPSPSIGGGGNWSIQSVASSLEVSSSSELSPSKGLEKIPFDAALCKNALKSTAVVLPNISESTEVAGRRSGGGGGTSSSSSGAGGGGTRLFFVLGGKGGGRLGRGGASLIRIPPNSVCSFLLFGFSSSFSLDSIK
mmetsp:Transcript_44359/g.86824  ORF Transcript_44359/g.86824 Transcript_44359/m.86824 type:complete len:233 (-) Transcript_44359:13-711(-)